MPRAAKKQDPPLAKRKVGGQPCPNPLRVAAHVHDFLVDDDALGDSESSASAIARRGWVECSTCGERLPWPGK